MLKDVTLTGEQFNEIRNFFSLHHKVVCKEHEIELREHKKQDTHAWNKELDALIEQRQIAYRNVTEMGTWNDK